jgi:hypothetical protein
MAPQIFISYAHADNIPYEDGAKGWVSNFVENLLNDIGRREGGSEVECWMDHRLEPQYAVDDELCKRIKESTCILAFMSPRYLKSEWCQGEMNTFVKLVGGGSANNRVFLIELLPTNRNDWHPGIQSLSTIELWHKSFDQPEPMLLGHPVPDLKGDKAYWGKLNYLASIMARQIQALSAIPTIPASPVPAPTLPVLPTENPSTTPAQMCQSEPLSVVINADKPDRDLGKQIRSLLDELDVDAKLSAEPLPDQLPEVYRKELDSLLQDSHGVLIVYGSAPPIWVQVQHSKARKVLATQRKGVWGALVDGPPEVKPELDLGSRSNLLVLDCRKEGPSRELLEDFVQKLKEAAHV